MKQTKRKNKQYPVIFILGAATASGKDTVMKLLKKQLDYKISPSQTTRNKRRGEKNGIYKFITLTAFKKHIKNNDFLEYDQHFGNYYGTLKSSILKNIKKGVVIKQIDISGMKKIKKNSELKYNKKTNTLKINNQTIKTYFVGIKRKSLFNNISSYIKRGSLDHTFFSRILRMLKERNYVIKNADYIILNPENHAEIAANNFYKLIKKLK
jgi:guanylate kinase